VIGLSSAYHLARAGIRVTLIERDRCGRGASFGNAGWIVPSLIQPFNAPGAVPRSLRAMLNPHSPIALRQVPTWALIRWGLEFFRASRADRSRASLRALAVMAASAADDVTALADRLGFEVHRTGLLVPFRSPVALDAYRQLTPRSSHWATRAGSKSWTPTLSRAVNRRWPTTSSVDCTCSTRSASVGGGHVSGAAAEALGELARGMPVIYASRTRAGAVLTRTYGSPGAELDLRQRAASRPVCSPPSRPACFSSCC
jgi:glycine/D-amino acid oxidase-like deaminating enzyme